MGRRIAIAAALWLGGCLAENPDYIDGESAADDSWVEVDGGRQLRAEASPTVFEQCVDSLDDIGVGDFTVSFTLTVAPYAARFRPIASQRNVCSDEQTYWAIGIDPNGFVNAKTNDQRGGLTNLTSTARIDDSARHTVVVSRRAQWLSIAVDGVSGGKLPSATDFGQLPELEVGNGRYCDDTAPNTSLIDFCIEAR